MINVDEIESGTVIDHIDSGRGRKVLELLKISDKFGSRIAIVMNVPSKKIGKKDIVKIEGMTVSQEQANLIALVAPNSTINIVKNAQVSNKYNVSLPKELKGAGNCPNPSCITNKERAEKEFRKVSENSYRCFFCERVFGTEELV